ncbi:hypothetical protein [Haladaptatus sp. CMAA 1911]|uniref:hypothetical protein n=1 Tax=unclassified Haladaptatus TaxID=2622732 RepID=UPI0037549B9F
MNRRKLLQTTGAVAAGISLAGCTGGITGNSNEQDKGDEPVNTENPGWFDIDSNILEEKMGQEVMITQSSLLRTSDNFGVFFTVKNKYGAPLSNVTAHARLKDQNDEIIDDFETTLAEIESIDDLAPNETWRGEIIFEDTNPDIFFNEVVAYDIWATAQAEQTVANSSGNQSAGNTTEGNNKTDGGNSSSS